MAVLSLFPFQRQTEEYRNRVRVDDVAKWPLSPQKWEEEKGKKKKRKNKTHELSLESACRKMEGSCCQTKSLKRGFGAMGNSLGVICGFFSKEQTCCIPPGISWPERDRRDTRSQPCIIVPSSFSNSRIPQMIHSLSQNCKCVPTLIHTVSGICPTVYPKTS